MGSTNFVRPNAFIPAHPFKVNRAEALETRISLSRRSLSGAMLRNGSLGYNL
jgi:hypothetical protein